MLRCSVCSTDPTLCSITRSGLRCSMCSTDPTLYIFTRSSSAVFSVFYKTYAVQHYQIKHASALARWRTYTKYHFVRLILSYIYTDSLIKSYLTRLLLLCVLALQRVLLIGHILVISCDYSAITSDNDSYVSCYILHVCYIFFSLVKNFFVYAVPPKPVIFLISILRSLLPSHVHVITTSDVGTTAKLRKI